MHWTGWIVMLLVLLNGSWMLFDGSRALIVGDYVTPSSGEYAGRLGPWAGVVKAVGIDPRSTLMKLVFVIYGLMAIIFAICLAFSFPWAWWGMMVTAVLGLWYLPFGTVINLIVILLLWLPNLRPF